MIEILIGDDNKVSLKTTNGITETEIASTIVIEAMRNLKKPEPDVKSKLVLDSGHIINRIKIKNGRTL